MRCEALTAHPLRYLGLIGSKAKVRRIFDELARPGRPGRVVEGSARAHRSRYRRHHAQEIAVSIVAELIAAKHGKISEPNIAAVSMRWEGALRK